MHWKNTVYENDGSQLTWREQYLYGSSWLGMAKPEIQFTAEDYTYDAESDPVSNSIAGKRVYELNNHLGNMMSTVSDIKTGHDDGNGGSRFLYCRSSFTE